jgi:hypothetical protein
MSFPSPVVQRPTPALVALYRIAAEPARRKVKLGLSRRQKGKTPKSEARLSFPAG